MPWRSLERQRTCATEGSTCAVKGPLIQQVRVLGQPTRLQVLEVRVLCRQLPGSDGQRSVYPAGENPPPAKVVHLLGRGTPWCFGLPSMRSLREVPR